MNNDLLYKENVSSTKTEFLFIALTVLFLLLFIGQVIVDGFDLPAIIFVCFFLFFLFYSINYRMLVIRLTSEYLKLSFGIFSWTVPFENIEKCQLDNDLPVPVKYGGAGIHFILVGGRYRTSFNFLEHPRVVIGFKKKVGPVRDISFSTSHPDNVLRFIQKAISAKNAS